MDLIATEDGSLTSKDEETGELFHNRAGAYSEALLNYVTPSAALKRLATNQEILLADVCFGLGYNSFVLIEEAIKNSLRGKLKIIAIEKDNELLLLTDKILSHSRFEHLQKSKLNFASELYQKQSATLSVAGLEISMDFRAGLLENLLPALSEDLDFIFHDPFSPKRVPELWTIDIFCLYFQNLRKRNGAILTYSSAAAVRGGLVEAGFVVKRSAALGGKSGGTIAMIDPVSDEFAFEDLDQKEQEKLQSRSGIPYRSMGFSLDRSEIIKLRTAEQKHLLT